MNTKTAVGEGEEGSGQTKPVGFWEAFRFWVKLRFHQLRGARWPDRDHAPRAGREEAVGIGGPVSEDAQLLHAVARPRGAAGRDLHRVEVTRDGRGIVAGSFFVIPSIFVLWLLSYLAVAHSDVPTITGLLYGIQPVVIAIVVEAVLRIGKRTINHRVLVAFAVLAFVALYFLSVPFPLVVLAAAVAGLLLSRTDFAGEAFAGGGHDSSEEEESAIDRTGSNSRPSLLRNAGLLGTFVLLWALPVGALYLWRGGEDVLVTEALFFTGAAFLTFGGAYSVLSYVSDVAVNQYGWLTADQMVQGLGLAESTPGPLIMVTQYVGFIGAWNDPGPFSPLLYGTLGALITTYATFLPCFLFIFFLAPYIELLANNTALKAVLIGVTAAVVGVIANLAVYFATQVLFPEGVSLGGLDVFALVVAVVSFVVLQRYKVPIYLMVPAGALVGMAWTLLL